MTLLPFLYLFFVFQIPLGRPKLVDDAVPSVFPTSDKKDNTERPTAPRRILPKVKDEDIVIEEHEFIEEHKPESKIH